MRLDRKVAIVTGGAQGRGGAHTETLVSYGATSSLPISATRRMPPLPGVKRVHYVHLDVREFTQWERAVTAAESAFGRLTTLINNAGFPDRAETTEEGWSHAMDVDLKGTWLGMKASVPAFRRAGGGAVVNTSSRYAVVSSVLGSTAYGPINCVIPGVADTQRNRTLPPEWSRDLLRHTPLGRMARPDEVLNAVVFLASQAASFITGTSLVVDDGCTAI